MESSRAGGGGGSSERRHSRGRGSRRPDQAIYVPRALRERSGGGGQQGVTTSSSSAERAESVSSSLSVSTTDESCPDSAATNPTGQNPAALDPLDDSGGQELFVQLSGPGSDPCPWPAAWDQTVSYFVSMSLDDQADEEQEVEEEEEEEEEDASVRSSSSSSTGAPPSIASSDRESIAGDLAQEIMSKLTEEDISIEPVQHDYSTFENVWLNEEDFSHVIEIYDFPAMFKTDDLMDAFTDYSGGGMKIKWVDNTHALGVFSNETAAAQALSIRHPLLKTRPLSKASKKSKGKAVRRAEFIQPVKERPRTDTAVARRMVTRALGLQRGGTRGKRF
ncbi:R3H and coiled-coil domain-containing protein 1 [Sardina pilchardus]|uniref:R3H and coiled-coil domain-containing protein 1 n=1 Tax=Sardina pilchardus TaxID=27697 RepID=UPI002E1644F1